MRYFLLTLPLVGFFLNPAFAADAGNVQTAGSAAMNQTLMLVVLFVAFYFMLIRPQTKRAKAHQQLVQQLAEGDEVVTSGGVMGRVLKITQSSVVLAVAKGVELNIQRSAITQALPKGTLKGIE